MAFKSNHDYGLIEPAWRANVKSLRQLVKDYFEETGRTITRAAISKHFKKRGIERDLKAKVRAKAEAMVSAAMVSGKVDSETNEAEATIINAEAKSVAAVQYGHRVDIPLKRELVAKLFAEVTDLTDGKATIAELQKALKDDDMAFIAGQVDKVVSLPARIKMVKDLAGPYKDFISLEREAFGIKPEAEDEKTINVFVTPNDAKL